MMSQRQVHRGLVVAAGWGLLGAMLAGCGSVTGSTAAGGGASASAVAAASTAAASTAAASTAAASTGAAQVGCASVNRATMVTVSRVGRLVALPRTPIMVTDRTPAQVRTLYRDFCNAVSHPDVSPGVTNCPADFGTDYAGVFYDGTVVLARFTYAPGGCPEVGLIAGSAEHSTMLAGPAATAAPHLAADFATVLDSAKTGAASSSSQVNPGGTNKPA